MPDSVTPNSVTPDSFGASATPNGPPAATSDLTMRTDAPLNSHPAPTVAGGQPGPAAPSAPPAAAPSMTPQQADVAHHSVLGKAFRFLMGDQIDYQKDPRTGQMTQVAVEQKPGQIFRSILAASILGGAMGSHAHSFGQGFGEGAGAGMEQRQQQDNQRYGRAEKDFQDQMEAQRNQREQNRDDREGKAFETEQQLRQAQIAHLNLQKMHENILLGQATFNAANEAATAGKAMMQPYVDAGLPTIFQNKSESEMHELWTTNPQAKNYLWEPTGTKVILDANGQPTYEKTYSAVDPKGNVQITSGVLSNFKRVGLDKFFPGAAGLKEGQTVSAEQMMALQHAYNDLDNKQKQQKASDLAQGKVSAEIAKDRAEAAHYASEVSKSKLETKQAQLYGEALDEYNKVGGDFDKLSPKSQVTLAESTGKLIADLSQAVRASLQADPEDASGRAKEMMGQISQLSALVPKTFKPNLPKPAKAGDPVPEDVAAKYIHAYGKDAAQQILNAGWTIPGAAPQASSSAQPAQDGGSLSQAIEDGSKAKGAMFSQGK